MYVTFSTYKITLSKVKYCLKVVKVLGWLNIFPFHLNTQTGEATSANQRGQRSEFRKVFAILIYILWNAVVIFCQTVMTTTAIYEMSTANF